MRRTTAVLSMLSGLAGPIVAGSDPQFPTAALRAATSPSETAAAARADRGWAGAGRCAWPVRPHPTRRPLKRKRTRCSQAPVQPAVQSSIEP